MTSEDQGGDLPLNLLAETEHFAVLVGQDDDGEPVFNVELGNVTLHLFREEWEELVTLVTQAARG